MRATVRCGTRLLVLAVAALLLAGANGATAAASPSVAVRQTPAAECPIAFIGMHGLNENHYTSDTIHSVWYEYWRMLPATTRLRDPVFLGYPQRSGSEFYDRFRYGAPAPDDPVEEGFRYLRDQADSSVKRCLPARLVLVGYSAGAWSIDEWLRARPELHSQVLGVVLFGDPQWDHGDQAQGLARRYGQAVSSPYVPKSLSSRFQSWCTSGGHHAAIPESEAMPLPACTSPIALVSRDSGSGAEAKASA